MIGASSTSLVVSQEIQTNKKGILHIAEIFNLSLILTSSIVTVIVIPNLENKLTH